MAESIFMGDVRPSGKNDPFFLTVSSPTTHDARFEAARQAMLVEYLRMLGEGKPRGLSDIVAIVGDTQNVMLQLATLSCDSTR